MFSFEMLFVYSTTHHNLIFSLVKWWRAEQVWQDFRKMCQPYQMQIKTESWRFQSSLII